MGIDQVLHHTRVGQGRDIAQGIVLTRGNLAQDAAHDLARPGLRQPRRPLDHIRRGDRADFLAHPVLQFQAQLLAGLDTGVEGDIHIDALPLDVVRHTHHRGLGHFRMRHHGTFDLGSTHAVTGHVQHVIHATGDPVVAILVAARTVTGEVHATEGLEVGIDETVVVAVQRTRLARPGIEDHQVAFGGTLDQVAQVVHQRRHHAEERAGCRARLEAGSARQRADQDAAGLGLPPGVDDRATLLAHGLVVPVPGFGVDRLTHRAQQAQAGAIGTFNSSLPFGHHRADGGWRGVQDVDLVLVDDLRHAGDVGVVRHAFEQQGSGAVGQRAVDDVAVAGDPTHVGGAPVHLARAIVEHALMGQRGVYQVAASGVQHALRLAGGTRGIKDEQRFLGTHLFWRAVAGGDFHQVFVPDVAVLVPGNVATGALAHDDLLHAVGFRVGQRQVDVGLERGTPATAHAFVGGNHDLGLAVDDTAGQRLGREAAEHHRMDRTDTGTGQHGDHGLGDHRHIDGDHVTPVHILATQGVGELADLLV